MIVVGGPAQLVTVAVEDLRKAGASVEHVSPDNDGDAGPQVEHASARLGGVDIAAADARSSTAAGEVTREHWEHQLKGPLPTTRTSNQAAFQLMSDAGGGHVVNLADQSAVGSHGALTSALAQAIVAPTDATAGAWGAAGVRVNVLQPSLYADPATVAPVLVFLCGNTPLHGQTVPC